MRTMPGAHYPDPPPLPDGPTPEASPDDERAMALRFVRTAFDPPLPDPFADWLIVLHTWVRAGRRADATVVIPQAIADMGYRFQHTVAGGRGMPLAQALRLFGRDDLLWTDDSPEAASPLDEQGAVKLAASLAVLSIHSTVNMRGTTGMCTLTLTDEQAGRLSDFLIPPDASQADHLGHALELLDHFVDTPRPTPCQYDHHGQCEVHHDILDNGRSAQHDGYDLLLTHRVRQEES